MDVNYFENFSFGLIGYFFNSLLCKTLYETLFDQCVDCLYMLCHCTCGKVLSDSVAFFRLTSVTRVSFSIRRWRAADGPQNPHM